MNYAQNVKYFETVNIVKIIGIVMALIGFFMLFGKSWFLGFLLAAAGIYIFVKLGKAPTDAEIDAQAAELSRDIQAYAMKKMAIEEEQLVAESIIFWGYDIGIPTLTDPVIGQKKLEDKKGSDGKWRSPHVAINVILFTENEIHSLRRFVSLVSNADTDKKDEFAYKHVAGISSDTEKYEYTHEKSGKKQIREYNVVVLRSGGERFNFKSLDNATAENAEKALKTVWRQKNA